MAKEKSGPTSITLTQREVADFRRTAKTPESKALVEKALVDFGVVQPAPEMVCN
jgi:hypothetical protein